MKKRKSRKPLTEARKPRVLIVFFSIIAAMLAIAVIWISGFASKKNPTWTLIRPQRLALCPKSTI